MTQATPTRRRTIASLTLAAYLGFGVWTFVASPNVAVALAWFVPVSLLLWLVLRAMSKQA